MHLYFDDHRYSIEASETVLDCLIRHGVGIPNACRSGVCQSCMLKATEGDPGEPAQKGLRPSRIEQNYLLACCCKPTQELHLILPDNASISVATQVISIEHLNASTARIRLNVPEDYVYHAGQYLRIFHPSGESRCYSIASLPDVENFLELHIKKVPHGLVSHWLTHELQPDDSLSIGEAIGDCYYIADNPQQPLLLIGTGTGLAPLYGVLRDAIAQQHQGMIHLYHGVHAADDLYLIDELLKLNQSEGFDYQPSVSAPSTSTPSRLAINIRHGRCNELALLDNPSMAGWRAYICGNPNMVKSTQKAVFLAGASMSDILADSFLPTTSA